MNSDELQDLSTEELDVLVHDLKGKEAADINNQGREAQIAYLTFTPPTNLEHLFVGGGKMPDGSPCPVYCHKCIPKDLDIGSDDVEVWETHSDGWTGPVLCSVCLLSIPVIVDGTKGGYWDEQLKHVDTQQVLIDMLNSLYPTGSDPRRVTGEGYGPDTVEELIEIMASHGIDIK
jgi:hypothetical protein